jgi:hypothetical protein
VTFRYGYSDDSRKRIDEIDRKLAAIQNNSIMLKTRLTEQFSKHFSESTKDIKFNTTTNKPVSTKFPSLCEARKEKSTAGSVEIHDTKKENFLQKEVSCF